MDVLLTPLQLASEGQGAYQRRDFSAAGRAYQAAAQGYQVQGDALNAAEMLNNASVALLQAGEPAAALALLAGQEAIFAAAGDLKRQAMTFGNRAAAFEALRQLDAAQQAYEQSADLFKQAGEHELRAYALQSLSKLYYQRRRPFEALALMRAGVEEIPRPDLKQRLLKRLLNIPFRMLQGGKE